MKNMDTYEEVIDECSDDSPTDMMKDFVNKNLDDTNKNNLNEVNEIGVDNKEVEEKKILKTKV